MQLPRMSDLKAVMNFTVFVSALGYFVDMYDLLLFGIVRVSSLTSMGITGEAQVTAGMFLLNMQMIGMLTGGILWGILGDKRGRVSVLFGSIFLYSIANIANGFVTTPQMYALMRFLAGVGLAGELGAAITLVSETLPQKLRGYGTTLVASVGILGSVTAALVGSYLPWQHAYVVGGGLGLVLLVLRVKIFESGMYSHVKASNVRRGDFISLFTSWRRFRKYMQCILIGLPTWFVVGILITFSPEFGRVLGVTVPIVAGQSIMFTYLGLIFGDIASGFISQIIGSRKKVVGVFLAMTSVLVAVYLLAHGISGTMFYGLCFAIGFSIGYWAVFVTIASEQFGTNLRATVATTVPNFVRGSTVPITLSFTALRGHFDILTSAAIVGGAALVIAFTALYFMEESFQKNLDYLEEY